MTRTFLGMIALTSASLACATRTATIIDAGSADAGTIDAGSSDAGPTDAGAPITVTVATAAHIDQSGLPDIAGVKIPAGSYSNIKLHMHLTSACSGPRPMAGTGRRCATRTIGWRR